ncbi:Pimeloyl-ACP methyl ester carboxylesterase [Streptosporangium canum]|uniref:Pimeloyl-ACP methyl ester carboxylesterase n=1 Tax=Streptosporangium canum TaxID=324952 RepID=A0A1I3K151_9ACTN|nr:alpha/beta hydrolase [Streptosporangium canum]SFI66173.1 Pimeloyl-ACP methyl ester carboxylesterase [Streptosporangium canum]
MSTVPPASSPFRAVPEKIVRANGVDLATQAFGDPAAPPILLVSGAEATMDWWDDDFAARLAAAGRHVIRYDTRDTGRSTTFPVGAPAYTQDDLLADALGVLDGYGLASAHIVGVSMGGGLAQRLAVRHPGRVLTLTLISTSPGGPGGPENPDLPPMSEDLAKTFAEPAPGPDWADRDAVIGYFLAAERVFAGTIPVDEERVRRTAGRAFDRSPVPAAASNHWMIEGGEPVRSRLGEITAPALVLHGTADPLFPYGHAETLAREIPGATLIPLPGMGHQMPPYEVWDIVIPAIGAHTGHGQGFVVTP